MEVLEKLLMQEEQDVWPDIMPIMDDTHCNLDDWWDVELPQASEFESEMLTIAMEDDQFGFHKEHSVGDCMEYEQQRNREQLQARMKEQGPQGDEAVEEDQDDAMSSEEKKSDEGNSKNLKSERNRRKRLNQQLFTLRSLVPNITKMDKRSILVDAFAYLQSILHDIERELDKNGLYSEPSTKVPDALPVHGIPYERCAAPPAITEMEAQMLDEATYVLEIGCNKAIGALSQVQRAIEMLKVEITCTSANELNHDRIQTTTFIRVKRKSLATPAKLLNQLRLNAKQLGIHLPPDS